MRHPLWRCRLCQGTPRVQEPRGFVFLFTCMNLFSFLFLHFAGGRVLIPKNGLGGPSLQVLQGWGLSLVPFLVSNFHFPVGVCEADSDQPENQQNQWEYS